MNKKEEYQEIYINLDDSGKLSKKEELSVYAGIVFLSKQEKDKFITQYRKIINEIKSIVKKLEPHVKVEEKIDNKEIKNKTKACTSSCCSKDNDHHEGSKDKIHEHSHEKEESSNGKIEILKDLIRCSEQPSRLVVR